MTAFGTHNDTFSFFRYSKFAVALSYEATEKLSVGIAPSVGYAKETLSPLAPLILEHLLTGGFGVRFTEKVSFDLGAVYGFKNTVTYTNTSLPFGPHSHRINECLLCLYHPQL